VSYIGVVEVFRQAQIDEAAVVPTHPVRVVARSSWS